MAQGINKSSSQALEETYNVKAGDRIYVDFEEFLEKKANEESGISSESTSNNIEESEDNLF